MGLGLRRIRSAWSAGSSARRGRGAHPHHAAILLAKQAGTEPDATGYQGFYYHFPDMETGARAWQCELSTVDSALLVGGMLTAAAYFDGDTPAEREIRGSPSVVARVDWGWAQNGGATLSHGWRPEGGFLCTDGKGMRGDAALRARTGIADAPAVGRELSCMGVDLSLEECLDTEYLYAGPLFTHQLSHVWVDFRGIQDAFMRERGIDYFERLATRLPGEIPSERFSACCCSSGALVPRASVR